MSPVADTTNPATTDVLAAPTDSAIPSVSNDSPADAAFTHSTVTTDAPDQVVEAAAPAELLGSDDSPSDTSIDTTVEPESAPEPTVDESTDSSSADAFDTPVTPSSVDGEDLISIKQQALQDLTPLVDKLDQPAEEQFRTLMRMIQASDNPSLIKQAFETAQKITDDKERAQALLDVINEINYFTSQNKTV
jgi:hypothetical protein